MVANDRTTSIGASDWAAALGVCPWKSPFQLWAEKTGIAEPSDLSGVERIYWGNALEAIIIARFGMVTGRKVEHNIGAKVTRHPERPFLTATLDAVQTDEVRGVGALEAKNVDYWVGPKWKDEAPLWVQTQLQGQLACTGMPWGSMAGLIGGNRLEHYDAERNDAFIEAAIDKLAFFWTCVLDKIPPEPDGSIATAECLKRLYPKDDGEIIALPVEAEAWDRQLIVCKQQRKIWDDRQREQENLFKAALGTATTGVLPDGSRYTYKQQIVNHKAKEAYVSRYRVLRRAAK